MKIYESIEQNSEEWYSVRLGKFTASSFSSLFAAKTTKEHEKALYRVAFERLTGEQVESFTSAYMERGHELEQLAIERYESETFSEVQKIGFVEVNDFVGCSPDGFVGDDGLVEIKCPAFNTMINYLLKRTLPNEYKYQVHGQMLVTGRKWCDFVAFHPNLPMFILRVERDEAIIAEIQSKLDESIKLVTDIIEKIKSI